MEEELRLHGFGSFKDEVGNLYARLAEDLAERGIASLRIDFAGSGDSAQPWVENTYDGMVEDGRVALDWLIGLSDVDDDRVGLLGFSLGTKVAMSVAGTDPRVAAFASWSGSTANGEEDFQFFFDEYYDDALANGSVVIDLGFTIVELSIDWFETIAASNNLDLIANYENPLLAIAGSEDLSVNPAMVGSAARRRRQRRRQVALPQGRRPHLSRADAGPELCRARPVTHRPLVRLATVGEHRQPAIH